MKTLWIWLGFLLMMLSGCGAGGAEAKSAPNTAAAGSGYPTGYPGESEQPNRSAPPSASTSSGGFATADVAPSPPSAAQRSESSSSRAEPTPTPKERPGLATEWGEQRNSRVHDVSFVRADDNRPFALAALHYNDRAGVEALANFHAQHGPRLRETSAAGGAISVAIHDGAGEPLEAVRVGDRTFVVGEQGQRYTIVLTNHTAHRFEALATVDGLDVINGKPGSMQSRGYVLMPFATLEIDGFRQSQETVAAFRFAKVADSYAAQTGSARNVGVIGVAFFAEQGDDPGPWTEDELRRRDTANPFPGSDSRFARPPRR